MRDALRQKAKAHIRYKTSDGKGVPGATTITGLLNKPHLVTWANQLGLDGIDSTKYRDSAATVGTLAHEMVQAHLQGGEIDYEAYSPADVTLAMNALKSFYAWEGQHEIKVEFCERPLVSDTMKFGGTVDCYCIMDGIPTLLDFKTGKAIYNEYFIQLAAYRALLEEHGHPVERCRILRIGRDETEGFEERSVSDTTKYFDIFNDLLDIYYKKKALGW